MNSANLRLGSAARSLLVMALIVTPGALLSMSAPADAATVSLGGTYWVNYTADPGEVNNITVSLQTGNLVRIEQASPNNGVKMKFIGGGTTPCSISNHGKVAVCPASTQANALSVDLGDLEDKVVVVGDAPGVIAGTTSKLAGGPDHDLIVDGNRNSTIFGDWDGSGCGDDTMGGGAGSDTFNGGCGGDTVGYQTQDDLVYSGAATVTVNAGNGNDGGSFDGPPGARDTVGAEVERVIGTDLNDSLTCGNDECVLLGGAGDDALYGGDAIDQISGREGNDTIVGGAHNDQLAGGDGNDVIIGGEGDDTLGDVQDPQHPVDEELGSDFLIGNAGSDHLYGGGGGDVSLGGIDSDYTLDTSPEIDIFADGVNIPPYLIVPESGDDVFVTNDGQPEHIYCGVNDALDYVLRDPADVLHDC